MLPEMTQAALTIYAVIAIIIALVSILFIGAERVWKKNKSKIALWIGRNIYREDWSK